MKISNQVGVVYIILFLFVGFINSAEVIDEIGIQWYYLSFLNLFFLTHLIYKRLKSKNLEINFFKNHLNLLYSLYFLSCLISVIWALNKTVSIDSLSKIAITLTSLIIFNELKVFQKIKVYHVSIIFSVLLVLEVFFSLRGYFEIISLTDYENSMASDYLKGITGNKNITAASIAFKLPFVYYLLFNSKNIILKILTLIICAFTFFNLILLSARAVFLSTSLFIAFFIIANLISSFRLKLNIKTFLKRVVVFILPLIGASLFAYNSIDDKSIRVENRFSNINETDESVNARLRYYKKGFNYFTENPLIGAGIGNWQIISIKLDKDQIESYIIPYVAHNDFIELLVEIGFIGTLIYLLFIFTIFYFLVSMFFIINNEKMHLNIILLSLPFIVYFVDANLNFPQYRPIMQVSLVVYALLIHNIFKSQKKTSE